MKLIQMEKVRDGRYLKSYQLTYLNKAGREKNYQMVSRNDLAAPEDIGKRTDGMSIVAFHEDKLLLLREFRMGVNRYIYNLCAGMKEPGESMEACMERELYEETGLKISRIIDILPPSFSAFAISDVKTSIAFVEVSGEFADHTSENEDIGAAFYSREEVKKLLQTEEFSSRAQAAAYFFAMGMRL